MGAIKEKLRHLAGMDPVPSLALVMPWSPQVPGLQPYLERLYVEVHTTVGLGLQRGQGALRQQCEGLEQVGQHYEEFHARQRFSQTHTCPIAKGCHFGVFARLQESVCEQMDRWGREVFSSCGPPPPLPSPPCLAPSPPHTRPELLWPLPDHLIKVGTLEVRDDDCILRDVVAENAEGKWS